MSSHVEISPCKLLFIKHDYTDPYFFVVENGPDKAQCRSCEYIKASLPRGNISSVVTQVLGQVTCDLFYILHVISGPCQSWGPLVNEGLKMKVDYNRL